MDSTGIKEEGALRYDSEKNRLDLVTPQIIEEIGKVLTFGAKKYKPSNWREGMSWSRCIGSLKRHITEFEKLNDFDNESSLLHLSHAACNIMFLLDYYKSHPELDDRYRQPNKKIGLDIDDVVIDFVPAYCQTFGLDVPNSWHLDRDIFKNLSTLYKDWLWWAGLQKLFSPKELKFEVDCYITARDESLKKVTEQWLQDNGFPMAPIIFNRNKGEVCRERSLNIFIDDSPKNFDEINKAGTACYLMDKPWNRWKEVGYRRINNINDIIL